MHVFTLRALRLLGKLPRYYVRFGSDNLRFGTKIEICLDSCYLVSSNYDISHVGHDIRRQEDNAKYDTLSKLCISFD